MDTVTSHLTAVLQLYVLRFHQVCIVVAVAVCVFAEEAEKKTEKRGVVGLGYGGYGHGLGYAASPLSQLSEVSYSTSHYGGYGQGYAAPALVAAPAVPKIGYAAPAVVAAPAVTKIGYAAPAISYGHGLGYAGYAAAPAYAASYAAPAISYGHGLGYGAYGGYGYHH